MRHTPECIGHRGLRWPPHYAPMRFPPTGSQLDVILTTIRALLKGQLPPAESGGDSVMRWIQMLVPGRRNLRLMLIGTVLYGLAGWLSNSFPISATDNVAIRPGIAVPLFFGFAFGPLVGFGTGFLGNLLGDALSGYVQWVPDWSSAAPLVAVTLAYNLVWQVGNGLMGLIPGAYALFWHRYRAPRQLVRATVIAVMAGVIGMGFASVSDMLLHPNPDWGSMLSGTFLPIVLSNSFNTLILIPILLFNYERLDLRSTDWVHSGLLRRISFSILLSAFLPIFLLTLFLFQQGGATPGGAEGAPAASHTLDLTVKLGFTIVATLLLAVSNASLVALSISKPLIQLTEAAGAMEAGKFTVEQATALRSALGTDEVSLLSRLFGKMAAEVVQREQSLRQEVQQLRIEIDQSKRAREVQDVTDNEFFRALQTRARDLRTRDRRRTTAPAS